MSKRERDREREKERGREPRDKPRDKSERRHPVGTEQKHPVKERQETSELPTNLPDPWDPSNLPNSLRLVEPADQIPDPEEPENAPDREGHGDPFYPHCHFRVPDVINAPKDDKGKPNAPEIYRWHNKREFDHSGRRVDKVYLPELEERNHFPNKENCAHNLDSPLMRIGSVSVERGVFVSNEVLKAQNQKINLYPEEYVALKKAGFKQAEGTGRNDLVRVHHRDGINSQYRRGSKDEVTTDPWRVMLHFSRHRHPNIEPPTHALHVDLSRLPKMIDLRATIRPYRLERKLSYLMTSDAELPSQVIKEMFRQLACGVLYLHQHKICHEYLSPRHIDISGTKVFMSLPHRDGHIEKRPTAVPLRDNHDDDKPLVWIRIGLDTGRIVDDERDYPETRYHSADGRMMGDQEDYLWYAPELGPGMSSQPFAADMFALGNIVYGLYTRQSLFKKKLVFDDDDMKPVPKKGSVSPRTRQAHLNDKRWLFRQKKQDYIYYSRPDYGQQDNRLASLVEHKVRASREMKDIIKGLVAVFPLLDMDTQEEEREKEQKEKREDKRKQKQKEKAGQEEEKEKEEEQPRYKLPNAFFRLSANDLKLNDEFWRKDTEKPERIAAAKEEARRGIPLVESPKRDPPIYMLPRNAVVYEVLPDGDSGQLSAKLCDPETHKAGEKQEPPAGFYRQGAHNRDIVRLVTGADKNGKPELGPELSGGLPADYYRLIDVDADAGEFKSGELYSIRRQDGRTLYFLRLTGDNHSIYEVKTKITEPVTFMSTGIAHVGNQSLERLPPGFYQQLGDEDVKKAKEAAEAAKRKAKGRSAKDERHRSKSHKHSRSKHSRSRHSEASPKPKSPTGKRRRDPEPEKPRKKHEKSSHSKAASKESGSRHSSAKPRTPQSGLKRSPEKDEGRKHKKHKKHKK